MTQKALTSCTICVGSFFFEVLFMDVLEDVLEGRRVFVLEFLLRVEDFLERVGVDLEAIETNQKKRWH